MGGDSVQPAVFIPYDVESAGHLRALGVERIAAYAVELMHAKLAEEEIPPRTVRWFEPELVVRQSCIPASH